jgi:hypothetical protein
MHLPPAPGGTPAYENSQLAMLLKYYEHPWQGT